MRHNRAPLNLLRGLRIIYKNVERSMAKLKSTPYSGYDSTPVRRNNSTSYGWTNNLVVDIYSSVLDFTSHNTDLVILDFLNRTVSNLNRT